MPEKTLLDAKAVGERLGIGYRAALDLIHGGLLPTVAIPCKADRRSAKALQREAAGRPNFRRGWRVDPDDLEAFILKSKVGEVGIKVGMSSPSQGAQTHTNATSQKHPKSAKNIVKPFWYKEFQNH